MPNRANRTIAAHSFACAPHPLPTAASVAAAAKVAAMPTSIGGPLVTNGLSDRANMAQNVVHAGNVAWYFRAA